MSGRQHQDGAQESRKSSSSTAPVATAKPGGSAKATVPSIRSDNPANTESVTQTISHVEQSRSTQVQANPSVTGQGQVPAIGGARERRLRLLQGLSATATPEGVATASGVAVASATSGISTMSAIQTEATLRVTSVSNTGLSTNASRMRGFANSLAFVNPDLTPVQAPEGISRNIQQETSATATMSASSQQIQRDNQGIPAQASAPSMQGSKTAEPQKGQESKGNTPTMSGRGTQAQEAQREETSNARNAATATTAPSNQGSKTQEKATSGIRTKEVDQAPGTTANQTGRSSTTTMSDSTTSTSMERQVLPGIRTTIQGRSTAQGTSKPSTTGSPNKRYGIPTMSGTSSNLQRNTSSPHMGTHLGTP